MDIVFSATLLLAALFEEMFNQQPRVSDHWFPVNKEKKFNNCLKIQ